MSIRLSILIGSLSLTLLTMLFGVMADSAARNLARLSLQVYDEAFMGMSYLRAAQLDFLASRDAIEHRKPVPRQSAELTEDLGVAHDRAMSTRGRDGVDRIASEVAALSRLPGPQEAALVAKDFERVVEIFAGDGFRLRKTTADGLQASIRRNELILTMLLGYSLLITVLLTRTIVPPVRHAVRIAQAIAAGTLDNEIPVEGTGETGQLLTALSAMQSSISSAMKRIHALMAEQASNHAGEIATSNARMAAALDNMIQGLCLFDEGRRLIVVNRRFAEMFGSVELGIDAEAVERRIGLSASLGEQATGKRLSYDTLDGRSFSISRQDIAGIGFVCTCTDVSEQRAFEKRLSHMARHDALTGLPNRVFYAEFVQGMRERIQDGRPLAVICLDLDRFKIVNDTLGHQVGDTLLRETGERIREHCEETDIVVRLGGDEFVIIIPNAAEIGMVGAVARRVIDSLSSPFAIGEHTIVVGASAGIAIADTANISSDTLLKRADIALYRAKAAGRGTIEVFEDAMDASMQQRRRLEMDLRHALAGEEFEVFYQPLTSVDGGILGFEALLRWRHPVRGMINPAEFIPVAEEIGLIAQIGRWVLRQACSDAVTWPQGIKVAVNVSPLQFADVRLLEDIEQALADSGLSPSRLEIEITESVLLTDESRILQILHAVRAVGVRISMDDFGTGYSSLGYLRRFPFDKIKIDRSFISGIVGHGDALSIVRAIIGLGTSLGMNVNAEGVETEGQRDMLIAEGCNELQGYLISKPVSFEHVGALFRTHGLAGSARRNVAQPSDALV